MTRGSDLTRRALTEMVFALFADAWQLRLVPDQDHIGEPVLSPLYSRGELIRSTNFLRYKNANGYHIYGRPVAARHVLVDDLCEDAIDALAVNQLQPAVVVLTSKGNHQAWITISREDIALEIANAAAKLLARRYGGDPGAANCRQMGRMPGLTNRKGVYCEGGRFPWTRLARSACPRVPLGAALLIAEARPLVASALDSSASTLGACDPNVIDMLASDMAPVEAKAIYDQTCAELAERFNWSMPVQDRSRADFAIAGNLMMLGFERRDVIAVLLHSSAKASEINQDRALSYSVRTVAHATDQLTCTNKIPIR